MANDQFLTTEEVLEYLQVNLRTVYRLINAGKLPAVRVGRLWRFKKKDIAAWVAKGGNRPGDARDANLDPPDRARILVVDDEPGVRELVARSLTTRGNYEVHTASDGPAAIQLLRGAKYDLLITDLKMPGMDGLTVIREARRHSATLPIVIMTGFSTEASAIEAINLGVCGYLTKPFRLPRVLVVAARALGEPPAAEALPGSGVRS